MAQIGNLLLRQKYHQYKMYSPNGTYLGLLQNVTSPFNYNQTIGSAFAQLQINVGQSADVANLANEAITDESGNPITDEAANNLLIERQPDIVGSNNSKALIANNNLVKVYEYSNYYPNGLLVFSGYVSKWKATFGASNDILVTCISLGQDLNNYIVTSGDTSYISQTLNDNSNIAILTGFAPSESANAWQTWVATSVVPIGGASVMISTQEAGTLYMNLWQQVGTQPNPASDILLASGSVHLGIVTKLVQKVSFSSFPTVSPGFTYYIDSTYANDSGNLINSAFIWTYATGDSYAGGTAWDGQLVGASDWIGASVKLSYDTYFVIWQHIGSINGTYTNDDPSFILGDVLSNYIIQGGLVSKPAAGYVNTGVVTNYTFKLQTVLQAIQAVFSLAPTNWYWYVDPATNILQFKQSNTVADITIINKRHINEIDIEATKENIKNVAYFTGGDDGTGTSTNILTLVQNALGSNRVGLVLLSDNRVNSTSGGTVAAKLISQNFLNNNASETYITNITIEDQTMDINLLTLGMMVGFSGFGNFVDNLLLRIVSVNRMPDQIILQLGSLPLRDSQTVAQIQSQLTATQTVAIPSIPS